MPILKIDDLKLFELIEAFEKKQILFGELRGVSVIVYQPKYSKCTFSIDYFQHEIDFTRLKITHVAYLGEKEVLFSYLDKNIEFPEINEKQKKIIINKYKFWSSKTMKSNEPPKNAFDFNFYTKKVLPHSMDKGVDEMMQISKEFNFCN